MELMLWFILEKVVVITYNFLIAVQFFKKYREKRDRSSLLFFLSLLLYCIGFSFSLGYAIRWIDGYNSIYAIVGGLIQLLGAYLLVEFVIVVFYPKKSFGKTFLKIVLSVILGLLTVYAFIEYSTVGKSIIGSYVVVILWLFIYSALSINLYLLIKQVKNSNLENVEVKLHNLRHIFRFSIFFLTAVFLVVADSLLRTDLSVPTVWGFLGYIPIVIGLAYLSSLKS